MHTTQRRQIHEELPLVSIIIPVYNGERYLGSALQSVFEQDYRPFEVIVVDDGSVDRTADIAKSFQGVRYIYQENQGYVKALNAGLEAADGEFIAFLDADDIWAPNKLSVQVGYLKEHPECGLTLCRISNFIDSSFASNPQIENSPLLKEEIGLMTMVARKTVFERVGGFDPTYKLTPDWDWIARAKDAGVQVTILPETLMYRRIHDSNMSSDPEACRADVLQAFKASIGRKRQSRSG